MRRSHYQVSSTGEVHYMLPICRIAHLAYIKDRWFLPQRILKGIRQGGDVNALFARCVVNVLVQREMLNKITFADLLERARSHDDRMYYI